MSGLKINFAEVEDSFSPVPEGKYECVVEDAQVRESQSSDNDYISFELKIVDGEYEDRRLWVGASLSPKALFTLKEILVNIGAIAEDDEVELEWDDSVDVTPKQGPTLTNPDVVGAACVVATTNSVYENRERQDAWRSRIEPSGDIPDEEMVSTVSKPKTKAASGGNRRRKLR